MTTNDPREGRSARPGMSNDDTQQIRRVPDSAAPRPRQVFPGEETPAEGTPRAQGVQRPHGTPAQNYPVTESIPRADTPRSSAPYVAPTQFEDPQAEQVRENTVALASAGPAREDNHRKSGAAGILGGLLALTLIALAAMSFMYARAANRPAPEPVRVTETQVTTQLETTTVRETETQTSTVTTTVSVEPSLPQGLEDLLGGRNGNSNNGNGRGNSEYPSDSYTDTGANSDELDALLDEMFG